MFRLLKTLPPTLALAALSIFSASCGSGSQSQIRFVHTISNALALDVNINTTKVASNIAFGGVQPTPPAYTKVASGSVTIQAYNTGTTTNPIFGANGVTASLSSSSQYTVVLAGAINGMGTNALAALQKTDNNAVPTSGNVKFRVINASPSGPPAVDVYIEATPFNGNLTNPAISALADTQASSYVTLPWNSNGSGWTIIVTAAGSTTPYNGFNFNTGNFGGQSTGAIRTLVLTDVQNGSSMSLTPIVLSDLH